jgi:hypothetical protein
MWLGCGGGLLLLAGLVSAASFLFLGFFGCLNSGRFDKRHEFRFLVVGIGCDNQPI